ncbi:nucleotidyltransferase family protein [Luteolibacter flavescens]|uniref:Nucleotidyltransferase family protein n=1 Tax=Luteolibacter flavescens TaxID=1859460 RepID=A0ABT3FN48_9BACT|nr:nucleotidyltransferase family protein [Luteolibacter flavescens]MCW1884994.1 nucleotidyltransferase family protein [Luteolibacter flavescens]
MKVGAVILAAGKASRFGAPKQLLEIDGETLIDRACRIALEAGFDPVLRVLGGHAPLILERSCPGHVLTLVHERWEEGMGGSLAVGVRELLGKEPELDAILVMLADQPMVTVDLLDSMRDRLAETGIVLCDHGEATGPPALFGKQCFPELMALEGDRGAKAVAGRHPVVTVAFPDAAWDIDSPGAWERFLKMRGEM